MLDTDRKVTFRQGLKAVLKVLWKATCIAARLTYRLCRWGWRKAVELKRKRSGLPTAREDKSQRTVRALAYGEDEEEMVYGSEALAEEPESKDKLTRLRELSSSTDATPPPVVPPPELQPQPVPEPEPEDEDAEASASVILEDALRSDSDIRLDARAAKPGAETVEENEDVDGSSSEEPIDKDTFMQIMQDSSNEIPDEVLDVSPSAMGSDVIESTVLDQELQGLFHQDMVVKVQAISDLQSGHFWARVIHSDEHQVIFLRSEDAIGKGSLSIGDGVMVSCRDEHNKLHIIRTQVANSNGKDSPWFSLAVSRESRTKGLPGGINLPIGFYIVTDAQSSAGARKNARRSTDGVIKFKGVIREIDVNGLLLETSAELPENVFFVQDHKQMGILGKLDLVGFVISCRPDAAGSEQFLSTIQFENISPSAEQQLRALTGRRFLGNI